MNFFLASPKLTLYTNYPFRFVGDYRILGNLIFHNTGGSKIYTNSSVMHSYRLFIRNSPYKKVNGSGNIGLPDNLVKSYKTQSRIWDDFKNSKVRSAHLT